MQDESQKFANWLQSAYQEDKNRELLMDATDNENLSECCGAPIITESFCRDCKEHCK